MLHTEASFSIYSVELEDGCEEDKRKNEEAIVINGELSFGEVEVEEEGGFGGLNGIQTLSVQGDVADYNRMVEDATSQQQSKGNLEEYYCRAMLADPGDGQIISQYATLVWELHRDRDKCLQYFERAIEATPRDSNVVAAYASFLWGTGEED